jgi:hypothetical protein
VRHEVVVYPDAIGCEQAHEAVDIECFELREVRAHDVPIPTWVRRVERGQQGCQRATMSSAGRRLAA